MRSDKATACVISDYGKGVVTRTLLAGVLSEARMANRMDAAKDAYAALLADPGWGGA